MKIRMNKFLRFFIFTALCTFTFTACTHKPDYVMSQDEMVNFLTDLHKLDGALAIQAFKTDSIDKIKIYYYNALFNKYGITKANFDSSLVWYVDIPKKFSNIYNKVQENLTKFETDVKNRKYHPIDSVALRNSEKNIWPNRIAYHLTKDSTTTQIKFSIKNRDLQWKDIYSLSFRQQMKQKAPGLYPHAVMRIFYANGKVDSVYAKLHNDSILRNYHLILKARYQSTIDSITGKISGSKKSNVKMMVTIDSLKLVRKYDDLAQDSIRKVIQLIEHPVSIPVDRNDTVNKRIRSKVLLQQK